MPSENLRPNLDVAIAFLGGTNKAAKKLNVSTRTLFRWKKGIRQIPGEVAIEIERLTNGYVKRSDLRSDFWPPEDA